MIRVIYRWAVDPATDDQFIDAWREATQRIRAHEPGALGSTLLRPADTPNTLGGFARWQRRDDVEAFWTSGKAAPLPDATLESIETNARSDCRRRSPASDKRRTWMVEYSCKIMARTRPIHPIIRGAADKEAFAAALGQRLLEERLANQTERIRAYLGGDLAPGLSIAEAAQRYCALTSPDLYRVLLVQLHWTAEHRQQWLTDLLHTDLFADHRRAANQQRPQRRTR